MMKLQEALSEIKRLQEVIDQKDKEIAELRMKKNAGRKKQNIKWQTSYEVWMKLYESGKSIIEIINDTSYSRRTCYRYKAYYDAISEERNKKGAVDGIRSE